MSALLWLAVLIYGAAIGAVVDGKQTDALVLLLAGAFAVVVYLCFVDD